MLFIRPGKYGMAYHVLICKNINFFGLALPLIVETLDDDILLVAFILPQKYRSSHYDSAVCLCNNSSAFLCLLEFGAESMNDPARESRISSAFSSSNP